MIWVKQDGAVLISTPNWVSDGNERRSIQLPAGRPPKRKHQEILDHQDDNHVNENQDEDGDPAARWTAGPVDEDDTGYQPWETGIGDDDIYPNY
jgi:hypothetical protein